MVYFLLNYREGGGGGVQPPNRNQTE